MVIGEMAAMRPDFSGTWECVRCDGFEAYLDALHVSPHIKRALLASGSLPTHVISHESGGDRLEWCVDSPQGRVTSEQCVGHRTVTKNPHGDVVEVRLCFPARAKSLCEIRQAVCMGCGRRGLVMSVLVSMRTCMSCVRTHQSGTFSSGVRSPCGAVGAVALGHVIGGLAGSSIS